MEIRFGWQVAGRIFRSQVSAIGYQVRVFGFWCRFGEIDCPTANRLPLTPIVGRVERPRSTAADRAGRPYQRHFRVPGLSPQVSGTGYQVQVRVRGKVQVLNLYPNL